MRLSLSEIGSPGLVRVRALAGVACVSLLVGALMALAPSALAARGHAFEFSFGAPGNGNGQFDEPYGIAVNEATGDVYIVDKGNDRVEIFHENGGKEEYVAQFNGSGDLSNEGKEAGLGGEPWEVKTGQFDKPTEIAVDNSCHYHKLTGAACEKYDPSNEDVYVIDEGHLVVDKFSPSGKYIGQITQNDEGRSFLKELYGVAVGTDGTVYISTLLEGDNVTKHVLEFDDVLHNGCSECETGDLNPSGPGTHVYGFFGYGLAVGASGDVYMPINDLKEPVYVPEFSASDEKLRAIGSGVTGVGLEVSSGDPYVVEGSVVQRFGVSGIFPLESLSVSGLSSSGVAVNGSVGGSSSDVYVTNMAADVVDVFTPEPPGAPTVSGNVFSQVTSGSARVEAEVNPHGAATGYRVEYGRCAAVGCAGSGFESVAPVPDGFAGSGFELERVGVVLEGLSPKATYHFKVLASNEVDGHEYLAEGEVSEFTTQSAGGNLVLPDARVWELVSPPDKHGALINPIGRLNATEAALDGEAMTYVASTPTEADPAGDANHVQVFSRRAVDGGWSSVDIANPNEQATGYSIGGGQEYRFFSEDLSHGLVSPFGQFTPLSDGASAQTPYLRTDFGGGMGGVCDEDCYRPLVTGCPGAGEPCPKSVEELADVAPGTVFSVTGPECAKAEVCGPVPRAASPDLSAVVVESKDELTEGSTGKLYEWFDGRLYYAGTGGLVGAPGFVRVNDTGSRVVSGEVTNGVPLQEVDPLTGEAVQLDAGSGCGGCESGGAEDPVVAGEGAFVFFRDKHALTGNADSGEGRQDLYVCEAPGVKPECALTDLTPKSGGEAADVLGIVAAAEDGSSVYFVANGRLAARAVQGDCEEIGTGGECNLYVMDRTAGGWGAPRLVAVLSGEDRSDWSPVLSQHPVRLAGAWLAFMSDRSLTGYDTRDAAEPAHLDEEVYLYDAAAGSEGTLVCASCNPTGERPHGVEYQRLDVGNGALAGGDGVLPGSDWVAANVPGWTPYALGQSIYESRYLSSTGRLFFDSSDALVPQDIDGTEDVYEYEPTGVGSCTSESETYSERSHGCVNLISSGESSKESAFLDASANGSDVFFLTYAPLSSEDHDEALDVYDAHECSASAPCAQQAVETAPACNTEASCRPAPTPQPSIFGAPASATFNGPGNPAPSATTQSKTLAPATKHKPPTRAQKLAKALKQCGKDRNKARRKGCEAKARGRYGVKRKGKAKAKR